ncbi:hypothetical protein [Amycolatopsis rhizosphaerae]|uniref:hypothetical protein n=1 Tax=Amycolatopsis rhizosphaerae TaxID=2053003 RepID=UPI001643C60F|nr:hypothetical protein [Amycolatopsis rhizosphaerae]
MKRVGVAAAAAVAVALGLAFTLGLLGGTPRGAGDNGDGYRLFCGAGLVPATPTHTANWRGGVVLDFDRGAPCADPQPSSAGTILKAAAGGHGPFSLTALGWTYVLLVFLATLLAAWAVQAHGSRRLLFLLPPAAPLLEPSFARFFLSTFGEPAGLFGAYTMLCGVAVIAATRVEEGLARLPALVLVGAGGVVAGLAKIGFLPLLVMAVLVCAVTGARLGHGRWWTARLIGPALAVMLALEAIVPVRASLAWQDRHFAEANAVNVVYTLALVDLPGSAPALGLPAAAQDKAGNGFFPKGPDAQAGGEVVRNDPHGIRNRVWTMLFERPTVLARVTGIAVEATYDRGLTYLPDQPWTPASVPPVATAVADTGVGFGAGVLQHWAAEVSLPGWPSLLVLLGMAAGVVALVRRRGRYGLVPGIAATSALGVAAMTVLGDGYFELAKHVWLAGYLLDVTALSLGIVLVPAFLRARARTATGETATPAIGLPRQ